VTYDAEDDQGHQLTGVNALTAALEVPSRPVTLTVRARVGAWTSLVGRASDPCLGLPDAPDPVTAVASDGRIDVSWKDPEPNGGKLLLYATVTASPGGTCVASAPDTSCAVTGLTNGVESTITVRVTSDLGTGPASAPVVATPYPSEVLNEKVTALWLDAAHPGALRTAEGKVVEDGTRVGVWRDRSTAGHDAVQKDPERQAVASRLNGPPRAAVRGHRCRVPARSRHGAGRTRRLTPDALRRRHPRGRHALRAPLRDHVG